MALVPNVDAIGGEDKGEFTLRIAIAFVGENGEKDIPFGHWEIVVFFANIVPILIISIGNGHTILDCAVLIG